MAEPIRTEIRAALRDDKRLSVAITDASTGQRLGILIGTGSVSVGALVQTAEGKAAMPSGLWNDSESESTKRRAPKLTPREIQILTLIAKGFHNRQIAAHIHRSIKTVEKHRQNLNTKLSTHEVAGLTRQAVTMGLLGKSWHGPRGMEKRARQLTRREIEILKLVAQGSGNKWIASELHRSIKTVDHHRENIMKKLGVHEVAGLTRFAISLGLT